VDQGIGIVYTRTGRRFFIEGGLERALLERLAGALSRSGLWEQLRTDWVLIDAELLPWSAKAPELLKSQYAADPASAAEAVAWWEELTGRGGEGMVVKPLDFIARARRGLIQPALKTRDHAYLRIIVKGRRRRRRLTPEGAP